MQYVDCDRAEKHGNLCLGYSGDTDEPCEQCQNCIKCESGTYQLGETEKDDQLIKAKEIIKNLLILKDDHFGNTKMEWRVEVTEQAEQFLEKVK